MRRLHHQLLVLAVGLVHHLAGHVDEGAQGKAGEEERHTASADQRQRLARGGNHARVGPDVDQRLHQDQHPDARGIVADEVAPRLPRHKQRLVKQDHVDNQDGKTRGKRELLTDQGKDEVVLAFRHVLLDQALARSRRVDDGTRYGRLRQRHLPAVRFRLALAMQPVLDTAVERGGTVLPALRHHHLVLVAVMPDGQVDAAQRPTQQERIYQVFDLYPRHKHDGDPRDEEDDGRGDVAQGNQPDKQHQPAQTPQRLHLVNLLPLVGVLGVKCTQIENETNGYNVERLDEVPADGDTSATRPAPHDQRENQQHERNHQKEVRRPIVLLVVDFRYRIDGSQARQLLQQRQYQLPRQTVGGEHRDHRQQQHHQPDAVVVLHFAGKRGKFHTTTGLRHS